VNDRWRTIAIILAVVLALLGGITAAVVITGGPAPVVLPSPTTAAGSSAGPSVLASSSSLPSSAPSAVASVPAASPTPVPSPTPQANLTTIAFTALKLDAQKGTLAGLARTFAFTTEGPGKVTVVIKPTVPSGRTIACLKPTGGTSVCHTGPSATLTGTTIRPKTNWIVTAIGSGSDAPTLDIGLTFGTGHPSVTLTNGRFDGKMYPYDGATFKLTTPRAGSLVLKGDWGGHAFDYALLVEPASTPPHGLTATGNAPHATGTFAVAAGSAYNGTLANLDDGFGLTSLTLTVTWP
jgi:hypothetical protein